MKMVSFDVFPHLNMIPGSDANFDKILANIHLSMDQTILMSSSKIRLFQNSKHILGPIPANIEPNCLKFVIKSPVFCDKNDHDMF